MDTSETYIKMCEAAEEIQEHLPFSSERLTSFFWYQPLMGDAKVSVQGWSDIDTSTLKYVWLPRQDQLQEMVGTIEVFGGEWVQWLRFCVDEKWIIREYPLRFRASMEQLWLAFVMKKKFNKTWDGREWHSGEAL